MMLAQRFGGFANLPLAAQEHQDVPRLLTPQLVDRGEDGRLFIRRGLIVFLVELDRAVTQLDWIAAAGDVDDRCIAEVPRETLRVDRRRRDDQLEVRPFRQQPLEIAEQEIDVERTLVRFIDDDRVVGIEKTVALRLGQQNAIGHQLDEPFGTAVILEAQLVADQLAERCLELFGDPRRHRARRDAPRLRVADDAGHAAPGLQTDFRQLRCFSGAGFAAQDDDRVLFDRAADLVAIRRDRQFFGIGDRGDTGRARRARPGRGGEPVRERSFRRRDVVAAHFFATQPIALAAQSKLVAPQAGIDDKFG